MLGVLAYKMPGVHLLSGSACVAGIALVDTSSVGGKVPSYCVFVVDTKNGRVLAMHPLDLELIWVVVGSPLEGQAGTADGQLLDPAGIAACGERFAVADTGNYRVAVFRLDGTFIRNIGSKGTAPGEFAEGPIQVPLPSRITRECVPPTPRALAGRSPRDVHLSHAPQVALDAQRLYVVEREQPRVQAAQFHQRLLLASYAHMAAGAYYSQALRCLTSVLSVSHASAGAQLGGRRADTPHYAAVQQPDPRHVHWRRTLVRVGRQVCPTSRDGSRGPGCALRCTHCVTRARCTRSLHALVARARIALHALVCTG